MLAFLTTQQFPSVTRAAAVTMSKEPQTRAATFEEMHALQQLGRIIVDPSGRYFLFEWARPYSWLPTWGKLPTTVRRRAHTFLYKVETPDVWSEYDAPTTQALLPPAPGATYYLGDISPDGGKVAIYELDLDDGRLRVGIVPILGAAPPQIRWLDAVPDVKRLEERPHWKSNNEIVVPVGSSLQSVNIDTGQSRLCSDCIQAPSGGSTERAKLAASAVPIPSLPPGSELLGKSETNRLEVYALNNADVLAISFAKNGSAVTVFQDQRTRKQPQIK